MTTQHTPGLLQAIGAELIDSKGRRFSLGLRGMKLDEEVAFALHLKACWNAIETAGIDPAAVEGLVAFARKVADEGHNALCDAGYGISRPCTCFHDEARGALANTRPEDKGDDDGVHDR